MSVKLLCVSSAITAFFAVSACSAAGDIVQDVTSELPSNFSEADNDSENAIVAGAVEFTDSEERDDARRDFEYFWPAEVSAIPALAQQMQQKRSEALAQQKEEWQSALTDLAEFDCGACRNNSFARNWEVVADLPQFLSLSANQYVYGGGAHGNYWFDSMIWDRKAEAALAPRSMFVSDAALGDAVRQEYCAALDVERAKRRGGTVEPGLFADCPASEELTLLIGSTDGASFNRLGLLAAPYVAGPYVEGSYEVTLPMNAAILEAVKPEYRENFALGE
ncbi:MAG: DUF4163 domain-containing protein [Erythrobacter sp.]